MLEMIEFGVHTFRGHIFGYFYTASRPVPLHDDTY
jgi:hypothetical protein